MHTVFVATLWFVCTNTPQLLAVRWREPEFVAEDTPAHPTTPVERSFSLKRGRSRTSVSSNSEQLQQDEEEKAREEEEGEREEEKEGSREASPPTPQLLIEALTASLKKVCQVDAHSRLFPGPISCMLCNINAWNGHC